MTSTTTAPRAVGRHERVTKPGIVPFFSEDRTAAKHNSYTIQKSATCPACNPATYPRHAKHRAARTAMR